MLQRKSVSIRRAEGSTNHMSKGIQLTKCQTNFQNGEKLKLLGIRREDRLGSDHKRHFIYF